MKLRKSKARQTSQLGRWITRGVLVTGAAYVLARSIPELVRYLRILRM